MPIYRYRCAVCQEEAELILPINDRDNSRNCGCGGKLLRLITAPTFKIKGSPRDLVLSTLNRESKTLPRKQVELLSGGLEAPSVSVTGRGFGR